MYRTGYSFKTAFGHLAAVAAAAHATTGGLAPLPSGVGTLPTPTRVMPPLALADRCSTFGYQRWAKACKALGRKPAYGIELGVCANMGDKKPTIDYWTFYATTNIAAINNLLALATAAPCSEPCLTYAQAMLAEDVIKITGDNVDLDQVREVIGIDGNIPNDFYFGLRVSTNADLVRQQDEFDIYCTAMQSNFYPTPDDEEPYKILMGFQGRTQMYPMHIIDDEAWREHLIGEGVDEDECDLALQVRDGILKRALTELPKSKVLVFDKQKSLMEMCVDGAAVLGVDLADPVYAERLKRELDLIHEKEFDDYIYIVADMLQWAKQRMIVGPGRGSSAGSLACYLLGITSVDPIKHDLIFERFIDVTRKDSPDIDSDFSDKNRHLVFEYAEQKYGKHRVARLGTVSMYRPKSILKTVGAQLRIPMFRVTKLSDSLLERSSGDKRSDFVLEDTFTDTDNGKEIVRDFPEILISRKFEAHPSNAGQHAAGILITEDAVDGIVAIDSRTGASHCDKKDAEDYNLLKIDALGLAQLSIFERVMELIGEKPINGFLEKIPLDDQKAFDVVNDGKFIGIFQFMGRSLMSLAKQIKFESFEDFVSITSLARPGPLANGGAFSWVKRRMGKEKITYPHPLFEPYLKTTHGILTYQEQVLNICREIGDMSWGEVTIIRKAMSKSLGKEYFDLNGGTKWKENAKAKGIVNADKVWDDITESGQYIFNRSHAVSYGLVSYWCCWLKAHHPVEFASASLDAESDSQNQLKMLRELALEGVDYVPVDAEHSQEQWSVRTNADGSKTLVGPLTNIKGIGPRTVQAIQAARAGGKPLTPAIAAKLAAAKTSLDDLFPISAAIKRCIPDMVAANILTPRTPIGKVQCGIEGSVMVIGVLTRINVKNENESVNILKRKGKVLSGPVTSLGMFIVDDTGSEIYAKIDRYDFEAMAKKIVSTGRVNDAIWALKGTVPKGFRMVSVQQVRHIGYLSDFKPKEAK